MKSRWTPIAANCMLAAIAARPCSGALTAGMSAGFGFGRLTGSSHHALNQTQLSEQNPLVSRSLHVGNCRACFRADSLIFDLEVVVIVLSYLADHPLLTPAAQADYEKVLAKAKESIERNAQNEYDILQNNFSQALQQWDSEPDRYTLHRCAMGRWRPSSCARARLASSAWASSIRPLGCGLPIQGAFGSLRSQS